jgi:thiol-disulfide isomerase/thioredoxin
MKTEIVIARYNENLDWLKKIKKSKNLKITVYNKGPDDIDVPFIKLPNIGRESHTYLYHIINNYTKLADQTIFCQGDSIFHSPDFLDLINKHRKKFEPVQPLTAWYADVQDHQLEIPPKPLLEETEKLWFGKKGGRVHVEYKDNNFVTMYPYFYTDNWINKLNMFLKSSYGVDNPLEFNVERFRLKDVDLDYLIPHCYAAIFSINKEPILENSVDFYNNIMSILIYDVRNFSQNKKFDHGLYLERLWLVIFNYKKYNKNYIPLKVKDYELQNYELKIKNNRSSFSYFNIYCNLFINLLIDSIMYNVFISKYIIYIKTVKDSKTLYKYDPKHNKNVENILKNMSKYNVSIIFNNNILQISINNNKLIDYNFDKNKIKHKNLGKVVVYDIAKYNKLIDDIN